MKKFLSWFVVASIIAGPALGADASVTAPVNKAPPWVSAPNWTGCYGGLNVGGVTGAAKDTWSNISEDATGFAFAPGAATGLPAAANGTFNGSGVIGGAQLGCIVQSGLWVWGAEGDIQYAGLEGSRTGTFVSTNAVVNGQISESFRSHWLSTIRGRLGFALGPVLFYGTGGVAIADVHFADQVCFPNAGTPGCNTASATETRVGFAAGGGIEWEFAPMWSVKAEYLYVDLGTSKYNSAFSDPTFPLATITHSHHLIENVGRVGLNAKF